MQDKTEIDLPFRETPADKYIVYSEEKEDKTGIKIQKQGRIAYALIAGRIQLNWETG